jgi:hypothetical protein
VYALAKHREYACALEKAWAGAKRRNLDTLSPADIDAEIAGHRRKLTPVTPGGVKRSVRAILEPGVLRAVDLHQLAQAIAPPARLMRRGETMPTVLPQPIRHHHRALRNNPLQCSG